MKDGRNPPTIRRKMTLEIRNKASHGDRPILRPASPASLTAVDRGMNGTVENGSYMQLVLGYWRTINCVENGLSILQTPAKKTSMNWQAANLDKEWRRFKQHSEFTLKGPLATKPEGHHPPSVTRAVRYTRLSFGRQRRTTVRQRTQGVYCM